MTPGQREGWLLTSAVCALSRGSSPSARVKFHLNDVLVGSSAQNGSALKREFSGGSYSTKRQPMPSPSEGSLSSGGLDQGSDAPARDYDAEVSTAWAVPLSGDRGLEKSRTRKGECVSQSRSTALSLASAAAGISHSLQRGWRSQSLGLQTAVSLEVFRLLIASV